MRKSGKAQLPFPSCQGRKTCRKCQLGHFYAQKRPQPKVRCMEMLTKFNSDVTKYTKQSNMDDFGGSRATTIYTNILNDGGTACISPYRSYYC